VIISQPERREKRPMTYKLATLTRQNYNIYTGYNMPTMELDSRFYTNDSNKA